MKGKDRWTSVLILLLIAFVPSYIRVKYIRDCFSFQVKVQNPKVVAI